MRAIISICLTAVLCGGMTGCVKPATPSLTGTNMFHDIGQVKKGMGANEVLRVMGSHYTPVYQEGLQGMDSGIYAWDYAEGRVYFNFDGVMRVVPAK